LDAAGLLGLTTQDVVLPILLQSLNFTKSEEICIPQHIFMLNNQR